MAISKEPEDFSLSRQKQGTWSGYPDQKCAPIGHLGDENSHQHEDIQILGSGTYFGLRVARRRPRQQVHKLGV